MWSLREARALGIAAPFQQRKGSGGRMTQKEVRVWYNRLW